MCVQHIYIYVYIVYCVCVKYVKYAQWMTKGRLDVIRSEIASFRFMCAKPSSHQSPQSWTYRWKNKSLSLIRIRQGILQYTKFITVKFKASRKSRSNSIYSWKIQQWPSSTISHINLLQSNPRMRIRKDSRPDHLAPTCPRSSTPQHASCWRMSLKE